MNQHLQSILNLLQQNNSLAAEEKSLISKSLKDANKELEIAVFKLDRTEKVKRTTAILLEETIEELEQKRKAVEAQNRELEIESSLERVRAVAMSMMKPDDLLSICEIMFHELKSLGFAELRNAMIDIHYDEKKYLLNYDYSENSGKTVTTFVYNTHPIVDNLVHHARQSSEAFTEMVYAGEDLNEWRTFRKHNGETDDPRLDDTVALYYYFYSIGTGAIGISAFEAAKEGKLNILKRFRNVFDLAYKRYIDITNAEAQAREALIEAALEKVRSRSLAMHSSRELSEVVQVVFNKLQELNLVFKDGAVNILLFKEGSRDHVQWSADPFRAYASAFEVAYTKHFVSNALMQARESGMDFFSKIFPVKEKNEYFRYLFEHSNYRFLPDDIKELILGSEHYGFSVAFAKESAILIPTNSGRLVPENQQETLKRFANVFDQAYIRFLDLQKAEAQTRESQIQLSLERVRARTMAMHQSGELAETASVLFQQIKELGFKTWSCGFCIWKDDTMIEAWMGADSGGLLPPLFIPYKEERTHHEIFKAAQNREPAYEHVWEGKELEEHYNFLQTLPSVKEAFDMLKEAGLTLPASQCYYVGFFKNGYLLLITKETNKELKEISRRFAQVFDLTYTRFLDLQKAEAQTKESQIQLALERVRARTLAMQKSDELAETSAVLFKQLILLGISPNRLYISIMKDDVGNSEFWITDEDGSKVSMAYEDNLNNNASFKKMFEGWKGQKKSLVIDMKGEELTDYFTYLSSIHVPFKGGLTQKRRLQYIAYFSQGFIGMASPDEQPAETLQLLERFAYVFNLTFTRFNDLQLAEAHSVQAEQDLIEIKAARKKAEDTLSELQVTQRQLVQSEKMASLGELTAGIAHEIQNPLNFVNNFSEVSKELLDEMKAALESGNKDEAEEIANDIIQNLEKINHHGKRADAIVKGMLQHSRKGSGQKEPTDINALCDEYVRLCYHGLRAKDKSFNANINTDFDTTIEKISIIPQDISRVMLNILTNAFYAVNEKKKMSDVSYQPSVSIQTKQLNEEIEISIKDNGNGIPQNIIGKIFQPFFTTKPAGQGTGLGLSLAYDIITKEHNGMIKAESKEEKGSEFIIQLPVA